jgi:hypothetical protein
MREDFLLKVADILEKTAGYIDAVEGEKLAAEKTARETVVKTVAERYSAVTGETLSDEELSKLASDSAALGTVQKMLDKTGGAVESMGRPSKTAGAPIPANKDQARQAAFDRFGSFLQT